MQSKEENNNKLKGLRELRENKGLKIESVADTLKLTTDVIKKLEDGDFENLGAYTYVRGYLNNYAKLLEIEAHPYIDLIPKSKLNMPLVNTSSNNSNTIKLKKHSKNLFNYATGTVLVIAVSFSGYFLLKNYSNTSNSKDIVEEESLNIIPQKNLNTNNDTKSEDKSNENFHYSSLIPTGTPSEKNRVNKELLTEDQFTAKNNEDTIIENLVDSDASNTQSSDIDNQTSNDSLASPETLTNNNVSNPFYNVVIEALETSWVKVENEDGKLHNDLLKPGSVSIQSDKPIHFRIGNEKNVKVTINGKQIDISNYASKDIADFNWPIEG